MVASGTLMSLHGFPTTQQETMMMIRLGVFSLLVFASAAMLNSACAADDAAVDGDDVAVVHDLAEDPGHEELHEHGAAAETPFLLKVDPGAALWNLAIFAVVFLVLAKFVWPPILEGLQARETKIREDLVGAERSREEAAALLSGYQAKLGDAQVEVQAMLADARRDAEQTKQSILADAKAEADRQRDRAIAEIESAKTAAISDLANQSSAIALQLARQVVGRELNENDHADLIRQSLDTLPSNN
ncbi:MAG: F0F1 ATP synthase subunit B [Pirellulaceae bacterium]